MTNSLYSILSRRTFSTIYFCLNSIIIYAQSVNCSGSATIDLTIQATCIPTAWSNDDNGTIPWHAPCGVGSDYQDVWYEVIGSGKDVQINLSGMNSLGTTLAAYTGCPTDNVSAVSLLASGTSSCSYFTGTSGSINVPTVLNQSYYIQIQRKSGTGGAPQNTNQNGNICAFNSTTCGNPSALLNDFCENPAIIWKSPSGSFSASTDGVFTDDHSVTLDGFGAGTGSFCGLIHNNSWYKFIASATTEVFPFSYTSCEGVQAHAYRITYNANGCCTGFVSVSNCLLNIPSPAAGSVVTASGLTIGEPYLLMVDGYLGAQCDFTISGWSGTGILPIELIEFAVILEDDKNVVLWKTASEHNNDYFNIHRSFDGINFDIIETLPGAGNSNSLLTYQIPDYDIRSGIVYYQLEQLDFDGKRSKSDIVSVDRKTKEVGLISVYPNPTESQIIADVNVTHPDGGVVRVENLYGIMIHEYVIKGKGTHQLSFDMKELNAGIYFIKYADSEIVSVKSILKK